jgi:hypothetical protein
VDDENQMKFPQEPADDAAEGSALVQPNPEIRESPVEYPSGAGGERSRDQDNPLDFGDMSDISYELERQARETMRVFRESAGDLGTRVRQVLDHASTLWEEVHPGLPGESTVTPEEELHGRALARAWTQQDFLVDPDMPENMTIHRVHSADIWRVELRERGESRSVVDSSEPYSGQRPAPAGPVLPVWDYVFPSTPDIQSGERRERISGTAEVAACRRCNSSGHIACSSCDGKGFVQCPTCHGRSRIPCRRCRGRALIADPKAERRARASKGYFQVQAERLRQDASERLVDFAERLRQDYGIPLPPTGHLVPLAPASGETIPCPDCVNGTVACTCGNGKLVCETCAGTGAASCAACSGTGKIIRHHELARRFDTRISQSTLPMDDPEMVGWLTEGIVRKSTGNEVWNGPVDAVRSATPAAVPPAVWANIQVVLQDHQGHAADSLQSQYQSQTEVDPGARHVISRRLILERVPVTRVEYMFASQPFAFLAVGQTGRERFWAQSFPPRWSRVSRFLRAVARDLQGETGTSSEQSSHHRLTHLDDFRARKASEGTAADEESSSSSDGSASARDRIFGIREVTVEEEAPEGTPDSEGE